MCSPPVVVSSPPLLIMPMRSYVSDATCPQPAPASLRDLEGEGPSPTPGPASPQCWPSRSAMSSPAPSPSSPPCWFRSAASSPSASPSSPASSPGCFRPFWPSPSELRRALCLLDMNRDRKIWAHDLDAVLELSYGVDPSSARDSWAQLKDSLTAEDGLLLLASVLSALETDLLFAEVAKMPSKKLPSHRPESLLPGSSSSKGCSFTGERRRSAPSPTQSPTLAPQRSRLLHLARPRSTGSVPAARSRGSLDAGVFGKFHSICDYVEKFNEFDLDENGLICSRDLKDALQLLSGEQLNLQECKDIIRRVDRNQDGVVDLSEFRDLLLLISSFC